MTETTAAATPGQSDARQYGPTEIRRWREELDCSRAVLQEMTGLSGSRVWAAEQLTKEITDEHYQLIVAALTNVKENGIPEHLRTKKAGKAPVIPRERIAEALELLKTSDDLKTLKEVRAVIAGVQSSLTEILAL